MILWFEKKNWNFVARDFILMAISVGSIGFMYVNMPYQAKVIGIFYMDP